jgi:hypothetical protein
VLIGEFEELIPVERRHIVMTAADVVANSAVDGSVDVGPYMFRQTLCIEQSVDRISSNARQKFAAWVGPTVLLCAGDVTGRGAISAINSC